MSIVVENIIDKNFKKYKENLESDELYQLMINVVTKQSVVEASLKHSFVTKLNEQKFQLRLDTWKVSDQKSSGRCWIFAGVDLLRSFARTNLNVDDFELSSNYVYFWDKFERANWYLKKMSEITDIYGTNNRLFNSFNDKAGEDGGQWDQFRVIIHKYGIVPSCIYPETHSSNASYFLKAFFKNLLREYASVLVKMTQEGKSVEEKDDTRAKQLQTVYRFLSLHLGPPPDKFNFWYVNKEKKRHDFKDITPNAFYQEVIGKDVNILDYVSVVDDCRITSPQHTTLSVQHLGSIEGFPDVEYLNSTMSEIKQYTFKILTELKRPVWVGVCMNRMFWARNKGFMSLEAFDYKRVFESDFVWDKGTQIIFGETEMSHAMLVTGVNYDPQTLNITEWRIQNSWGEDGVGKGFITVDDTWFGHYVLQIAIDKKHLNPEDAERLKNPPHILPFWDPLGTLAQNNPIPIIDVDE